MIKKLQQLGNSSALVIDRPMMDLMEIDRETPLRITVQGRKMIIEPLSEEERQMHFQKIMKKTGQKNAELFKRLAK
jgi:antitoxin MazE